MNPKRAKPFEEAEPDDVMWFVQPDGAIFAMALYDYVCPRSKEHNDWDLRLSFTVWDSELYFKELDIFTPDSNGYRYWVYHLNWGIIEKYTDRCIVNLPRVYQKLRG